MISDEITKIICIYREKIRGLRKRRNLRGDGERIKWVLRNKVLCLKSQLKKKCQEER